MDCAPKPSTPAQSKERKGSNFAIWRPCRRSSNEEDEYLDSLLEDTDSRSSSGASAFEVTRPPRLLIEEEDDESQVTLKEFLAASSNVDSANSEVVRRRSKSRAKGSKFSYSALSLSNSRGVIQ